MKNALKKLLGEKNLGRIDYFLKPGLRQGLSGVFNGQTFRREAYMEIMRALPRDAIIETGTFLGTTTEFFAESGLPVYTVESNPRFFAFASLRLRRFRPRVVLVEGNSVTFLEKLARDAALERKLLFFYLDAHWYEHLPLREELSIIFSRWKNAVVLVDDFQVPGETYEFDDYGPGKALTMDYIKSIPGLELSAFFPVQPAEKETGLRRGWVVLAGQPTIAGELQKVSSLRPYRP